MSCIRSRLKTCLEAGTSSEVLRRHGGKWIVSTHRNYGYGIYDATETQVLEDGTEVSVWHDFIVTEPHHRWAGTGARRSWCLDCDCLAFFNGITALYEACT